MFISVMKTLPFFLICSIRKGSVVADLELTFSQSVSQGDVDALVLEATRDGKLGELEVSEIKVGGPIEGKLPFLQILFGFIA